MTDKTLITVQEFDGKNQFVATIPSEIRKEIAQLRKSDIKYKALDETVLLAILTSRKAIEKAGWKQGDDFGINIGSSRGATQLFEKHHKEFLETGKTATLTSPTTTLGNIFPWCRSTYQGNFFTIPAKRKVVTRTYLITLQNSKTNCFGTKAAIRSFVLIGYFYRCIYWD